MPFLIHPGFPRNKAHRQTQEGAQRDNGKRGSPSNTPPSYSQAHPRSHQPTSGPSPPAHRSKTAGGSTNQGLLGNNRPPPPTAGDPSRAVSPRARARHPSPRLIGSNAPDHRPDSGPCCPGAGRTRQQKPRSRSAALGAGEAPADWAAPGGS